jgi:hypothetical protein
MLPLSLISTLFEDVVTFYHMVDEVTTIANVYSPVPAASESDIEFYICRDQVIRPTLRNPQNPKRSCICCHSITVDSVLTHHCNNP